MTKEDIIRMAREAGIDAESDTLTRYEGFVDPLTRFATLIVATMNEFNPDWDQMAVLVEQSQEQTAKIEQLEKKLAERSAEHLAAHITYDKGYQEGRQDAEDAHKEFVEPLTRFANLAAAAEREACAKVCGDFAGALDAATAIRSRGQA